MRYNSRRSRPAIRSRMTGRSVEPPRREGQGLVLLMAQTVLCVAALAVVFTMQYVKPREYKILGEYYTEITREDGDKKDEVMRLLATPITAQQLQQWWEDWQPPKLAEVFAWADGQTAMGGEEPIFPRNASYRKVVVSVPAASPLPMDAVITSDYGERTHPISGAWDFHTGIDLAAAAGTKIYPVYAGVIAAVGSNQSYGNYVKLRHSENLETIYCHCEAVLCKAGDEVTVEDAIALVGSTGVSTGPHLHLSVLTEGYYVDPMNLYS